MKPGSWRIPRRTLVRGLGTAISLPFLEAMLPKKAWAADPALSPRRFFAVHLLHSAIVTKPDALQNCPVPPWTPAEVGPSYTLDPIFLAPFAQVKSKLSVLTGISERISANHGTMALKLVPRRPVSTTFSTHDAGMPSIDHLIANHQKQFTALPLLSLDLGNRPVTGDGSQPREKYLSWQAGDRPFTPVVGPDKTFDALFSSYDPLESATAAARRKAYRQSVLDAAKGDLDALNRKLGKADVRKLEEYATGIRDFEERLARVAPPPSVQVGPRPDPASFPNEAATLKAMLDLVVLAFRTDRTRVITLRGDHRWDANWVKFNGQPFSGVDAHEVSHYGNAASAAQGTLWRGWLNAYVAWGLSQYAYVLDQLDAAMDPDGNTVLDNSVTHITFDVCDSYRHTGASMPVLVGGRGGKDAAGNWNIKAGHRRYKRWEETYWGQGDPPIDTARFTPRPGETTLHDLLWAFHNICGQPVTSNFGEATHPADLAS